MVFLDTIHFSICRICRHLIQWRCEHILPLPSTFPKSSWWASIQARWANLSPIPQSRLSGSPKFHTLKKLRLHFRNAWIISCWLRPSLIWDINSKIAWLLVYLHFKLRSNAMSWHQSCAFLRIGIHFFHQISLKQTGKNHSGWRYIAHSNDKHRLGDHLNIHY